MTPSARNAPKLCPADPVNRAVTDAGREQLAELEPDRPAERRADGAVRVRDLVLQLELAAFPHRRERVGEQPSVELGTRAVGSGRCATKRRGASGRPGARRSGDEVERVGACVAGRPLAEAARPGRSPRRGVRRPSDASSSRTSSRDVEHVRGDALGRARELRAQARALGRDAGRARVAVARADHDAALGEHRRGAERVLVGAEERRDDDVASGLEPAVDAHPHPVAQAVLDERPLGVGEPELPRQPGVLDRRQRRRTGAAVRRPRSARRRRAPSSTPAAIVPTPSSATSFTDTSACGLTCFRS